MLSRSACVAGLSFVLGAAAAVAQCASPWLPGAGAPGVAGVSRAAVAWDPDGAGPTPERIVVGGAFHVAGTVFANNVAALDPQTGQWSALGAGFDGPVYDLAVAANGDLVAVGAFVNALALTTGWL